jgi:hypothetical protein
MEGVDEPQQLPLYPLIGTPVLHEVEQLQLKLSQDTIRVSNHLDRFHVPIGNQPRIHSGKPSRRFASRTPLRVLRRRQVHQRLMD